MAIVFFSPLLQKTTIRLLRISPLLWPYNSILRIRSGHRQRSVNVTHFNSHKIYAKLLNVICRLKIHRPEPYCLSSRVGFRYFTPHSTLDFSINMTSWKFILCEWFLLEQNFAKKMLAFASFGNDNIRPLTFRYLNLNNDNKKMVGTELIMRFISTVYEEMSGGFISSAAKIGNWWRPIASSLFAMAEVLPVSAGSMLITINQINTLIHPHIHIA